MTSVNLALKKTPIAGSTNAQFNSNSSFFTHSSPRNVTHHKSSKITSIKDKLEIDDKTQSRVRSVLFPLKRFNSNSHEDASHLEMFVKYFTVAVVLLPSLAAVFMPIVFPKLANEVDIAGIFTDALMIVSIGIMVKFAIEWPWEWLAQIKEVEKEMIQRVTSSLVNESQNTASLSSLETHLDTIYKLKQYEKLAWWSGVLGIGIGTILMFASRSFVMVDTTRKDLIFNNFNICLFVLWGLFRSIMSIYSVIQEESLNCSTDTKFNLSSHLKRDSPQRKSLSWLINMMLSDKLEVMDREKDLVDMSDVLNKILKHNSEILHLLRTLVETQAEEMSKISGSLTHLEKREKSLRIASDAKLSEANVFESMPEKSSVKPFPLNLKRSSTELSRLPLILKNQTLKSSPTSPLRTIFEESRVVNNTSKMKPKVVQDTLNLPAFSKMLSPQIIERKNSPIAEKHFSLHGLPFTSIFQNLITVDHAKKIRPNQPIELLDLNGYDGDQNSDFLGNKRIFSETIEDDSFLSDFRLMLTDVYENLKKISLHETYLNPSAMREFYYSEILPIIEIFMTKTEKRVVKNTEMAKTMVWEVANFYVFQRSTQISEAANYINEQYLRKLREIFEFWFLVFTRIPFNILRIFISLNLFIPKLLLKVLVVYPILALYHLIYKNSSERHEEDDNTSTSLLNPKTKYSPYRARATLLNQISKHSYNKKEQAYFGD